jgi:hypothetical protein
MPDRLSISLWLKSFDEDSVLEAFHKLLDIFPYSPKRSGVQTVTVHPLDWSEPVAMERHFPEGASAIECMDTIQEFQHADCAYKALVFWDVGQETRPVEIIAYGPDFEGRDEEQGHIEIDIGADTPYRGSRENIIQLVFLMHELPKRLNLAKRLLWAESGEDVSELLAKTIQ